ncbi:MAG: hypothetical protein KAT34_00815 [Candidatus Aminicenantes bacterium]|nr:hypothetical protein [Candidatus Aminicenantes bacterium]
MTKDHKYTRDSPMFKEAVSYRKLNMLGEAKKLIIEILTDQPDFIPALSEMGEIFTLEKDYNKAAFYFKKKLDLLPDAQYALRGKGVIYRLKGRIKGAIEGLLTLSRHKLKEELRKKNAQVIAASKIATANPLHEGS